MELHLKIIGVLLIALSLVHAFFPKYFKWTEELRTVSLINRQMMYIHTFFIAVSLFLMGLVCLTSASELLQTNLGKKVALGLGMFWLIRLVVQFFGYSSRLWKGKTFETTIHILATLLWIYLSTVFILTYLA
jgi:hypothetical protein